MVYKKYIKRNGKVFGPYTYKTERIDGKIKTTYVPEEAKSNGWFSEIKNKPWAFSALVLVIILILSGITVLYSGNNEQVVVKNEEVSISIVGESNAQVPSSSGFDKIKDFVINDLIQPIFGLFEKDVMFAPITSKTSILTSCGASLATGDTEYLLNNDVSTTTTCFSFTGVPGNRVLNCQGHTITISGSSAKGVNVQAGTDIAVKNCIINTTGLIGSSMNGIRVSGLSNRVYLINNTFNMNAVDSTSAGIYLSQVADKGIFIINNTLNGMNIGAKLGRGIFIKQTSNVSLFGNVFGNYVDYNVYFDITDVAAKRDFFVGDSQVYGLSNFYGLYNNFNVIDDEFGSVRYSSLDEGSKPGGTNINLGEDIQINSNSVYIKPGSLFAKSAEILFKGIPNYGENVRVLNNGVDCGGACGILNNDLGNGKITISVEGAGNYSIDRTRIVKLTVDSPIEAKTYTSNSIDFNFTAENAFECKIEEITEGLHEIYKDICTNMTLNLGGEGTQTYKVRISATDFAGDYSTLADSQAVEINFTIDTTRPGVELNPITIAGSKLNATALVEGVGQSGVSNVTFRLYNSSSGSLLDTFVDYDLPYIYIRDLFSNGVYYLNASAFDGNGNEGKVGRVILFDNQRPTIIEHSKSFQGGLIKVNFTISDNLGLKEARVSLYNSGGIFEGHAIDLLVLNDLTHTEEVSFSNILNGVYYFNISAQDNAGNNYSVRSGDLSMGLAPVISFGVNNPVDEGIVKSPFKVSADSSSSGITDVTAWFYNVNSHSVTTKSLTLSSANYYETNILFSDLADGDYNYNISATNLYGSGFTPTSKSITLDNSVPQISFGSNTDEAAVNKLSYYTNFSLNDNNLIDSLEVNLSNYSARYDNWKVINTTSFKINSNKNEIILNYSLNSENKYKLIASVNDSAGNVNTIEREFTVNLPPTIRFVSPSETTISLSSFNYDINVTDSDNVVLNVCLRKSGMVDICKTERTGTFSELDTGSYILNATATDEVGNVVSIQQRITIDLQPEITFVLPTLSDGSYIKGNILEVNASAYHANLKNISIYVYNSSKLVNVSNKDTSGTRDSLFVSLILPDGIYYVNATAVSTLGTKISTSTIRLVVDNSPPEILSVLRSKISNTYIKFDVQARDNVSGIKEFRAKVVNGSGEVIFDKVISLSSENYTLDLDNLNNGEYSVEYNLTDNAGNSFILSNQNFDFYKAVGLTGDIRDALGNSRVDNYTFYRNNSEELIHTFVGSSYNIPEAREVLHERTYDILVNFDRYSIKFLNLALNSAMSGKKLPFDIDNLTTQTVVNGYKTLGGIAVNTTFNGGAKIVFDYNPADLSDTTTNITIFKCTSWNYSYRTCNDESMPDYGASNYFVDNVTHKVFVNVSSFSAFILGARTCGNGNYQQAYGEEFACPSDANTVIPIVNPSGGGSPGGGGGGGGGGGAPVQRPVNLTRNLTIGDLEISFSKIDVRINEGDVYVANVTLTNKGEAEQSVSTFLDSEIENVVRVDKDIRVLGGQKLVLPVYINGANVGAYLGNLVFVNQGTNKSVEVKVVVKDNVEKSIDLKAVVKRNQISAQNPLDFKVNAYNTGQGSDYEVGFRYDVLEGNNTVYHSDESFMLQDVLSYSKSFNLPVEIVNGAYTLVIEADYVDGSKVVSVPFDVIDRGTAFVLILKNYLPLIVVLVVLIFIAIVLVYYFKFVRKKLFLKKMEELRAHSPYPFPNFDLLPKSNYAYIGKVADSGQKTFLDYMQLNRHTLIAGGTGSGKTVAGMVIVEELIKHGLSIIAFDPVGQWTGFAKKCEDKIMLQRYHKFGLSAPHGYKVNIIEITPDKLDFNVVGLLKQKGLNVLKMDNLSPKQLDEFIDKSLSQIYSAKLDETSSFKSLIVLDEVHRLIPKYGGKTAHIRLEQAVREFRKWGIGLLLISQVLTDFKGAIRGNIGTEIQMMTRYEGDIKRVKERHGAGVSQLMAKMTTGLGMVECAQYNQGQPYFVEFRPLLHSPLKLLDSDLQRMYGIKSEDKPKVESTQIVGERKGFIDSIKASLKERQVRAEKERIENEKRKLQEQRMKNERVSEKDNAGVIRQKLDELRKNREEEEKVEKNKKDKGDDDNIPRSALR
ncbi:MAG: helicase HerA-like domain-containing protein [Nanoarchaeota archaeon]